jgi:DUF4097 and DUF4098 domain-containing protein YvlB
MKTRTLVAIIVAASLILAGCLIFAVVMTMLNWNFKAFLTTKYVTNECTVNEKFEDIKIVGTTEDVIFLPSENDSVKVVFYEEEKTKHSAKVTDNTLVIDHLSEKRWYDHIGISSDNQKTTVYLPKGLWGALDVKLSTGDLSLSPALSFEDINIEASTADVKCNSSAKNNIKIKLSTGDITINSISASSLDIVVTTGDVNLTDATVDGDISIKVSTGRSHLNSVACKNLMSSGSTGDLNLQSVVATGSFSIKRSTGDVTLKGCDAAEIFIETDTGDVYGSLLTEKVFIPNTSTGKISVPRSQSGGICEITTNTGDIRITVG